MYSRYPRIQTRYPPQFHRRELVSFSPPYHDDDGTHNDTGNHYRPQHGQEGYVCEAECSTSAYPSSQMESISWSSPTSSDLQSDTGLCDNCNGFDGSGHDSLNFSSRTDFMPPPTNLALVSKDIPQDVYVAYNSMVLPTVLDSSFAVNKLTQNGTTNQVLPSGSAGFDSLDDIAMWDESLLSPAQDSFIIAHAGSLSMPADDNNTHTMHCDFVEHTDCDTLNMDILCGYMPNQQSGFQNPLQLPVMTMGYDFSNSSWPHTGATFSSAAPPFQIEPGWNLRNQGHREESPLYSFRNSPPLGNTFQQPHKSMSTIVNDTLYEVRSDSLTRSPDPMTTGDLPTLMPKPTFPSIGVITGHESNLAISIGLKKPGCRSGPLDAERRKGASQMRRNGACVICKLRKTRCSGKRGETCKHCASKKVRGRLRPGPCLRGPLPHFEDAFCPSFAFAHLELTTTEDWIEESNWLPVGNDILIQVSFCPVFSSMSFKVREISLANPDFLLIPDLSTDSHDRMQDFASVPSLPYALSDYNIDEVKSECLKYINSISKCPLHILEDLDENTSAIVWRSLEAVLRFLRANLEARQNGLLHKVIKLFWTLYAMGRDLNLSEESVPTAIGSLRDSSPLFHSQSQISARVLSRQIKTAMKLIYKELLRGVLEGLEDEYKSNTRISLAISFCTNIILSSIVGELETVFDGLAIYKIFGQGEDPVRTANSSIACTKQLNDVLTHYSWPIFFNNNRMYNFIKDECPIEDAWDQNQGVADLADDFRKIMRNFEDDITDQEENTLVCGSKTILDHKELAPRNSSRHVLRYLKRFY